MGRAGGRRALLIAAVTILLAACSFGPGDPYPLPADPPNVTVHNPWTVGEPIDTVLIWIEVRPGDHIELLGAEAMGSLDGAAVTMLLSHPVIEANGDHVIGAVSEPLEGAVLTAVSASPGPDNAVGIVARMTPQRPGRYEVSNVRLRYRLNGGAEQVGEGTDVVWTVCAEVTKPADCPDTTSE